VAGAQREPRNDRQHPRRDLNWLRASTAATVSVAATAEVLEVNRRTVQRAIDDGQLPVVRMATGC
jgi:excisionase family DNA binding protein